VPVARFQGLVNAYPLPNMRLESPPQDGVPAVVPDPGVSPMQWLWPRLGAGGSSVADEGGYLDRSGLGGARCLRDVGRREAPASFLVALHGRCYGDPGMLAAPQSRSEECGIFGRWLTGQRHRRLIPNAGSRHPGPLRCLLLSCHAHRHPLLNPKQRLYNRRRVVMIARGESRPHAVLDTT
jgi:hypothetical protein